MARIVVAFAALGDGVIRAKLCKAGEKLLSDAGWKLLRQGKGDHEIWHNPATGQRVTVVTFLKSRHLANAILKDAGLRKAF